MHDVLPALRADIQLSVHTEDGEQFLVLSDPFGIADGPIMVHADMLDLLQACDGETTYSNLALASSVEADGAAIMRVRAFVQQLSTLGYLEGEGFEARQTAIEAEWNARSERPPACAGTSYPADAGEAGEFFSTVLGLPSGFNHSESASPTGFPRAVLVPHIDYRVAPHVYAPGLLPLRHHPAELVIAIGTSHYWSDDAFILTEKDYQTPFGTVQTDRVMVSLLRQTLPSVAATDVAHRPEHALELHLVALKHLWAGKSFRVVPILVTPAACESPDILDQAVEALRSAVAASGTQAVWCISGDLAHVGRKFGDAEPAADMIDRVKVADAALLDHLEHADPHAYDRELSANNHAFRVCGYAPTMVALHALTPTKGLVTAYDVWHEYETSSAVSFASVVFHE